MTNQPAQQPSIVDAIDEILQEAAEAIARGVVTGEWLEANTKAALLAAFRSLAVAAAPEKLYSGKHNASHTWITNNYCHACHEYLSNVQQQEEFGHNAAIEQYQANILAGLENKS